MAELKDNFSKLLEVLGLDVVEQEAREVVQKKERERKKEELLTLAQEARFKRIGEVPLAAGKTEVDGVEMPKETREEREERLQREKICEERRQARERKRRLEAAFGTKSQMTSDRDRMNDPFDLDQFLSEVKKDKKQ